MGSKNESQYASLPNLSKQDLVYSNRNVNSLMLRRVHSLTLYRDHASNVFNEEIQNDSNTKISICKSSYSQLGSKPRSQSRALMYVSQRIQKKGSTKRNSTSQNTFFGKQSTFCGKVNRMPQTKGMEVCNGGKGRFNCRIKLLNQNC